MTQIANLVQQRTVSTGVGNLSLAALAGRQSFHQAFGSGGSDMFFYFVSHAAASEWEVGTGHLQDAATLVRDTVLASSNGGAIVNFSGGDKDVVNDIPAQYQAILPIGISGVSGLQTALDGKATAAHAHASTDITDFTEAAQDAVGTMTTDTYTVNVTYSDATPELKWDVVTQMSLTSDAAGLKLSGDSASPGNNKLYGTNGTGAKGWYDQPAGGGGGLDHLWHNNNDGWIVSADDLLSGTTTLTVTTASGTGASGGAAYTVAGDVNRTALGVMRLATGTTATGKAGRGEFSGTSATSIRSGFEHYCQVRLRLEDVPDVTEDYYVFAGFKTYSSGDPKAMESVGLYYDRNYANWQMLVYAGGVAAYTDTGVAFSADTWFNLGVKIIGNTLAGSVAHSVYINGAEVATDSGVTDTAEGYSFNYEIKKTAGVTQRYMYVDYELLATRRTV